VELILNQVDVEVSSWSHAGITSLWWHS